MVVMDAGVRRVLCRVRPRDREALRGWVKAVLGVRVPGGGVCAGHGGPLDYLEHVFFEREGDAIVWANRGGGKTFYGAVATLLDLVFKPGVQVRILGGSLEQSSKMYGYLRWMLDREGLRELVKGKVTERGVGLVNGSRVEILSQSEKSVRGQRVQKLRCDEVELFDREVWEAAQFVTKGAVCGGVKVRGSVEVMSTMHRPWGLMNELVGKAGTCEGEHEKTGWRVFKWCAMDVLGRCGEERACAGCGLWASCGGMAKTGESGGRGFLAVEDVMAQQRRSSREAWASEMLCRRPQRSDAVFPSFDPERHVRAVEAERGWMWVGGMDFGLRNPFVMLWAQLRPTGEGVRVEVMDEYVMSERRVDEHLGAMARRGWPGPAWVGVDPAGHQRSEQTGVSTIALLRRAGYEVRARRVALAEGLELIRRRLDPAGSYVGRDGESKKAVEGEQHTAAQEGTCQARHEAGLVVHPRCERLIEALTGYHFDAERPWREEPVKDGHDHPVDALRYLLVNLEGVARGKVAVRRY